MNLILAFVLALSLNAMAFGADAPKAESKKAEVSKVDKKPAHKAKKSKKAAVAHKAK